MDSSSSLNTLWAVVRFSIGATAAFVLYNGLGKAASIDEFSRVLVAHAIIPAGAAMTIAWLVTALEVAVACAAVFAITEPRRSWWGAALLAALGLLLSAYLLAVGVWPPPKPTSCGCGWNKAPVESWFLLSARNAALSSVFAIFSVGLRRTLGQQNTTAPSPVSERLPTGNDGLRSA